MKNNRTKITNIRISKWYALENIETVIDGSALIFAKNRVGKSTFIDAIMYTLTATKRFNRAANAHDERDLKSYVRKKVNGKYERNGYVSSNIAIEFTDSDGKSHVIGTLLESKNEADNVISTWYFIDKKISEIVFCKQEGDKKISLNKNEFKKENNIDSNDYLTQGLVSLKKIKERLGYALNVYDIERFITDMEKAVAFVPVRDLKQLLNMILSEDKIVIEELAKNLANFTNLKRDYELIEKAIHYLCGIIDAGERYNVSKNRYQTRECIIELAKIEAAKKEIEKNLDNIELKLTNIQNLNQRTEEIESEREQIRLDITALEKDGLGKITNQLKNIESQLQECVREIKKILSEIETTIYERNQLLEAAKLCAETDISLNLSSEISLIGEHKINTDTVQKELSQIKREINKIIGDLHVSISEKSKTAQNLSRTIEKDRIELANTRKGLNSYPSAVFELKTKIEKAFKENNINSEVKILCDMVEDILIPEWIPAIETILGSARYAIIVEPQYLKIAQGIQKQFKLYDTSIIATNNLTSDYEINPKSAFAILQISNVYAKRFLTYRLNNLILCNNLDELNSVSYGITQDIQVKSSLTITYRRSVNDYCLGKDAKRKKAERLEEKIIENETKKDELNAEVKKHRTLLSILQSLKLDNINVFAYDKHLNLTNKKSELEVEEHNLKTNPDIIMHMQRHDKLKERLKELDQEFVKVQHQIGTYNSEIERHKEIKTEKELEIPRLEESLTNMIKRYAYSYETILDSYKNEIRKKTAEQIIQAGTLANYRSDLENSERQLREAMNRYQKELNEYHLAAEVEELDKYIEKYYEYKNTEIEKITAKLNHQLEVCTNILKGELIQSLDVKISNAKKYINALNRDIRNSFREIEEYEYYFIDMKPTNDKELRAIYDLVTHKNTNMYGIPIFDSLNPEASIIDEKIKELIENLAKDDIAALEEFEQKICDYRNYFECDIITINDKTNEKISMLAKGNTTSGMETQAPYYIITAISIIKNMRTESDLRLMIMDEACDKMDTQNIMKVLNFLKSQGIQTILAAPPEKIACFENYVQTTIPLIKNDDGILIIGDINYAKENE